MKEKTPQRRAIVSIVLVAGLAWASCSGRRISGTPDLTERARRLYVEGRYGEALEVFEEVLAQGREDGELLYEVYDSMKRVGGEPGRMEELRTRALELLEEKVQGGEAGVAEYYYLAALRYDSGRPVEGARTGLEAVRKFLDTEGHRLTAVEYFQLGRLYDLMHRKDLSLGLYKAAAEKFSEEESPPPAYLAASLAEAARADLELRQYQAAAEKIDRAREIRPDLEVDPLLEGMVKMGAMRFEEAENAWFRVLSPAELVLECQARAALARKAKRIPEIPKQGPTGLRLEEYSDEEIEAAILDLIPELKKYRKTFPPGWQKRADAAAHGLTESERETLLNGMRRTEAEFVSLNLEFLLRGKDIREFSAQHGYLDLLQR